MTCNDEGKGQLKVSVCDLCNDQDEGQTGQCLQM